MLGLPRIETEFEFVMVFCFGIRFAPYVFFFTRIYFQHIARPVDSRINIVFVHLFFHCRAITLQLLGIDLSNFKI